MRWYRDIRATRKLDTTGGQVGLICKSRDCKISGVVSNTHICFIIKCMKFFLVPQEPVHYRALFPRLLHASDEEDFVIIFFFPPSFSTPGANNALVISAEECARSGIMFTKMLLKMPHGAHGETHFGWNASMLNSPRVRGGYTRRADFLSRQPPQTPAYVITCENRIRIINVSEFYYPFLSLDLCAIPTLFRSTIQVWLKLGARVRQLKLSSLYSALKRSRLFGSVCYVQNVWCYFLLCHAECSLSLSLFLQPPARLRGFRFYFSPYPPRTSPYAEPARRAARR